MNYFKCEARINNKPCLKAADYQGSLGHLLCGVCKEMIENKNPDLSLKQKALGYEGQQKIIDKSIRDYGGEPQLTGDLDF